MKSTIALTLFFLQSGFAMASDYSTQTAEVKNLLSTTSTKAEFIHCVEGRATCRKLILLKDKVTGKDVKSFYMVFSSLERQVGATEYFLVNNDGTFRSYLDDTFDGIPKIDFFTEKNLSLRVTFDSEGLPTIHDTHLVRHGSTFYAIADLMFSSEDSKLSGFEFDSSNSEYKKAISIIYKRTKVLEAGL